MNLDYIINRAIPIAPDECKIKKAKKEQLRLQTKKDLLILIAANFVPKEPAAEKKES